MSEFAPDGMLGVHAMLAFNDPHLQPGVAYVHVVQSPDLGAPVTALRISRAVVHSTAIDTHPLTWVDEGSSVALTTPFVLDEGQRALGRGPLGVRLQAARVVGAGSAVLLESLAEVPFSGLVADQRTRVDLPAIAAGARVDAVRVTGPALITAGFGFPASYPDTVPWRFIALPVEGDHLHYGKVERQIPPNDDVRAGATQRADRWDAADTLAAIDLPARTGDEEVARLWESGAADRVRELAEHLADGRPDVFEEMNDQKLVPTAGGMKLSAINELLLGTALDPALARYAGFAFADPDAQQRADEGDLILYRIDGVWDVNITTFSPLLSGILSAFAVPAGTPTPLSIGGGNDRRSAELPPEIRGTLVHLQAQTAVVWRAEPLRPAEPLLTLAPASGWLPDPSGTPVRMVHLALDGLAPPGVLAATRSSSNQAGVLLNPLRPGGSHAPLVVEAIGTVAGHGELTDSRAPGANLRYRVAARDLFGRWSDWSSAQVAELPIPAPPRPLLTVFVEDDTPAALAAAKRGPFRRSVRAAVIVPDPTGMAAGSLPLHHLEFEWGNPNETANSEQVNATDTEVVQAVRGPELNPAETGSLTVSAVWVDAKGTRSEQAALTLEVRDTRPPEPPVLTPSSPWTARPGADNIARATISWAGQGETRVYVAGEGPIVEYLGVKASAITGASDVLARAVALHNAVTYVPRALFRLAASLSPNVGTYVHDLSGDLRTLTVFRIVTVSSAGVESEFEASPATVRAVPWDRTAPTPRVHVHQATSDGDAAELTITVARRNDPAVEYRLRRGTSVTDPRRMPVVASGPIAAPPPAIGSELPEQTVVTTAKWAGLHAWTRYSWVAEVRCAEYSPELTAPWSPMSAPASMMVVPPDPPKPPGNLNVAQRGLEFAINEEVVLGSTYEYRLEAWARFDAREAVLIAGGLLPNFASNEGPGKYLVLLDETMLTATDFTIRILDPLGRVGTATVRMKP